VVDRDVRRVQLGIVEKYSVSSVPPESGPRRLLDGQKFSSDGFERWGLAVSCRGLAHTFDLQRETADRGWLSIVLIQFRLWFFFLGMSCGGSTVRLNSYLQGGDGR
jgi:hypothetical protein